VCLCRAKPAKGGRKLDGNKMNSRYDEVRQALDRFDAHVLWAHVFNSWLRIGSASGSGFPRFSWTGKRKTALARLAGLPDGAGLNAVIQTFPRERTPVRSSETTSMSSSTLMRASCCLRRLNALGEEEGGPGYAPDEELERAAELLVLTMSPEFEGWRHIEMLVEADHSRGAFDHALPTSDQALYSSEVRLAGWRNSKIFFIRWPGYSWTVADVVRELNEDEPGYGEGLRKLKEVVS